MRITKKNNYKSLPLNETTKGEKGFYSAMLEAQHKLVSEALETMDHPNGAHLVIEFSELEQEARFTKNIRKIIERWSLERLNNRALWFYVIEESRQRKRHAHLYVIGDRLGKDKLTFLKDKLNPKGKAKTYGLVKLQARKQQQQLFNLETAELVRLPRYYHALRLELADFYERFSYLAKVATKDAFPAWSHSRKRQPQKARQAAPELPLEPTACLPICRPMRATAAPLQAWNRATIVPVYAAKRRRTKQKVRRNQTKVKKYYQIMQLCNSKALT